MGAPRVGQGVCKVGRKQYRAEPGEGTGGTGWAEPFWTTQLRSSTCRESRIRERAEAGESGTHKEPRPG